MNEMMISPVNRADLDHGLSQAAKVEPPVVQPAEAKPAAPVKTVESKPARPVARPSDVYLKFQVDEDTNAVTVFVVDRATRKVVRSIPPDELNKLQAGDLLELLA